MRLGAHRAVIPNGRWLKQWRLLQFQMKRGNEPICFKKGKKKKKDALLWIVWF